MQKWEYGRVYVNFNYENNSVDYVNFNWKNVLKKTDTEALHDYLQKLGDEGWELVNATKGTKSWEEIYYFKRPKA